MGKDKTIYYKTEEEIRLLKASGDLVSRTLAEVSKIIKPGISTLELDTLAYTFINDHKATPSFLGYNAFPNSLCISVNDVVVHGIPSKYELKEGDIVSIDCGTTLNGWVGDSAYTFALNGVKPAIHTLLKDTYDSLYYAISFATAGKRLGDVCYAVQEYCDKQRGYGIVRELVGHGVGRNLHEAPEVPNYGKRGNGLQLLEGLVIAIEPMITLGKRDVITENDNWTVRTKDRKPAAHFEHTVCVRKYEAELLTTFKYTEEAIKANPYLSNWKESAIFAPAQ